MKIQKWFLCSNDIVMGPLTLSEVQSKIARGLTTSNCFIWWKGQVEWISLGAWEARLPEILQEAGNRKTSVWYVDSGANPLGPLTESELVANLRSFPRLDRVRVWSIGMEHWVRVFDQPSVMELLGLSRRRNERAPLMGQVALTRATDHPTSYIVNAASVSVAGVGITGEHDLRRDDQVTLVIRSAGLSEPLHLQGHIAYVTNGNYAGIRFDNVHAETQAILHDYVKMFDDSVSRAA